MRSSRPNLFQLSAQRLWPVNDTRRAEKANTASTCQGKSLPKPSLKAIGAWGVRNVGARIAARMRNKCGTRALFAGLRFGQMARAIHCIWSGGKSTTGCQVLQTSFVHTGDSKDMSKNRLKVVWHHTTDE
ncbi:hypothetical protein BgiMline_005228 [Biomphalaria glabrata]